MAKCPYPPDQGSYAFKKGSSSHAVKLEGGKPKKRKDKLGAWSRFTVTWTGGPEMFDAMMEFFNTTTEEGSLPFTIDLYQNTATQLTEHKAQFVDETFGLQRQEGLTFVIGAELEVSPKVVT